MQWYDLADDKQITNFSSSQIVGNKQNHFFPQIFIT